MNERVSEWVSVKFSFFTHSSLWFLSSIGWRLLVLWKHIRNVFISSYWRGMELNFNTFHMHPTTHIVRSISLMTCNSHIYKFEHISYHNLIRESSETHKFTFQSQTSNIVFFYCGMRMPNWQFFRHSSSWTALVMASCIYRNHFDRTAP